MEVENGVRTSPLPPELSSSKLIRVRFDLARGSDPGLSPLIDGFRVIGRPPDGRSTAGRANMQKKTIL